MPTEQNSDKQPKGAPELPEDAKELLEGQGDIARQKPTMTEADPIDGTDDTGENTAELETGDELPETTDHLEPDGKRHRLRTFFAGFWRHRRWTLPLAVVVIAAIVLAIPWSRYGILGTFMAKTYAVQIIDSKNNKPVSGATVTLAGKSSTTDEQGRATLKAKVGKRTITVSKKYYRSATSQVFVGITTQSAPQQFKLVATGRQVPVTVVDKLSGKPIEGAEIKVLDTNAKTDAHGKAIIVLPTTSATDAATITANGYNRAAGKVMVTSATVASNTFSLVPTGRVYFLSNLSGNVDVISANFDGSNRTTVAAGTGNEDQTTQLFVSPDQKYLALYAKRDDSGSAKLYMVNTSSGQLSQMDTAVATFSPVGWGGDRFVYQAASLTLQNWQPHQSSLKSYDAASGQIATLDQTNAKGTQNNYINQSFTFTKIVAGRVVYGLAWTRYFASTTATLNGQHNTLVGIDANGSNRSDLKDIALSGSNTFSYLGAVQPSPQKLYIQQNTDSANVFYVYQDGSVTQTNAISSQDFKPYPTYLVSPDGQHTFWSENRDGQSALFVGDANASNPAQVATLDSSFTPYGWDTNGYLLVSKGNNQLYVLPAGGLPSGKQPMKVSDYYASQHFGN